MTTEGIFLLVFGKAFGDATDDISIGKGCQEMCATHQHRDQQTNHRKSSTNHKRHKTHEKDHDPVNHVFDFVCGEIGKGVGAVHRCTDRTGIGVIFWSLKILVVHVVVTKKVYYEVL